MYDLNLRTVLALERAIELRQVPADEARNAALNWIAEEQTGLLVAEEGGGAALDRILRLTGG